MRWGADSQCIVVLPDEVAEVMRNCIQWQQERNHLEMAGSKIPQGQQSACNLQVDYIGPLSGTPGSYKWVLTRFDTYYALRFTYPVTEATLKNTVRGWNIDSLLFNRSGHNISD